MKVTGERLIPGLMSKDGEIEHFHRYSVIAEHVQDKVVLDAACGTGYGSGMLAQYAAHVYGLDISAEAIAYANENYSQENITFIQGGIEKLPFEDNTFDIVVSFETIEHVITEVQDVFLKEIKRVLKPTGFLVMSTPNKKTFTDERGLLTKFHFREFYKREFNSFLKREFSDIKIYHQFFSKVSNLVSYDENMKNNVRYNFDIQKEGLFFVAVASNSGGTTGIDLNSTYYYPDEYARFNDQIQIYYSANKCFEEESSVFVPISNRPGVISESVDIDYDEIKYIRLDPFSQSGKMRIVEVTAISSENQYIPLIDYTSNAESIDGDILTFYTPDPQILYELSSPAIIKNIIVQFEIYPSEIVLYDEFCKLREELKSCIEDKRGGAEQCSVLAATQTDGEKQFGNVEVKYKNLEAQYKDLEAQYTDLASELQKEYKKHTDCNNRFKELELQYRNLESQYRGLETEYTSAVTKGQQDNAEYNERYNQFLNLEGQYTDLRMKHEALEREKDESVAECIEIKKQYNELKEDYDSIINSKKWKLVTLFNGKENIK